MQLDFSRKYIYSPIISVRKDAPDVENSDLVNMLNGLRSYKILENRFIAPIFKSRCKNMIKYIPLM